ncbi:MAG: 23S rRNA (uridine(2552)-2'-O)-methyltransferase [Candidatus Syntrophoarchaeum sp.]|nr:23S rRNA (uridine(2552)-2'-O)-methyltransferase [Candidatus Syntrophoarchaeum sp.]
MVKQTALKSDRFYKEAKKEGYRSRSAFKLLQIVNKFELIKEGDVVVDLGAAPGGWSQVAKVLVGEKGVVISVDLQRIEKIEDVVIIKSDITKEEETVTAIKDLMKGRDAVNVVISDASPKLSGNRDYDHFRSSELSTSALNIASALLMKNGNFVAKIFQGAYYDKFYRAVKEKFRYARAYSPEASRKRSAEVYVIGKKFFW